MKQAVVTAVKDIGVERNMKILMICTVSIVNNTHRELFTCALFTIYMVLKGGGSLTPREKYSDTL